MVHKFTQNIRNVLVSRTFLNVLSVIVGVSFWNMITQHFYCTQRSTLPLVFDNVTETITIQAPETIDVTLYGSRTALRESEQGGAIHIDAHTLKPGTQLIHVSEHDILLPTAAKLIHYTPVAIIVTPVLP